MNLKNSNRLMIYPKAGKWVILLFCLALLFAGLWGYHLYRSAFKGNIKKSGMLYIPTNSDFRQVMKQLKDGDFLHDSTSFKLIAKKMNYKERIFPGAYMVKEHWNNNQLIEVLRSGDQTPVKVTFNNVRFRGDLAAQLAKILEPDSVAFMDVLNNDKIAFGLGVSREAFPMFFIPNTYEFYWNTTPLKFIERMKKEYDLFWNESRKKEADELGLTPLQVVTIASIIREETNKNDEKSRMAGVYINRLKKGWLLQADPTVKFALGNFMIKRILKEDLKFDSPYNTYKYVGLPPGPINFPDITSIDAVLNAEQNEFMFFCAKEDFSGYHNFAKTLKEHNSNAALYQKELNRKKILR